MQGPAFVIEHGVVQPPAGEGEMEVRIEFDESLPMAGRSVVLVLSEMLGLTEMVVEAFAELGKAGAP